MDCAQSWWQKEYLVSYSPGSGATCQIGPSELCSLASLLPPVPSTLQFLKDQFSDHFCFQSSSMIWLMNVRMISTCTQMIIPYSVWLLVPMILWPKLQASTGTWRKWRTGQTVGMWPLSNQNARAWQYPDRELQPSWIFYLVTPSSLKRKN